MGPRARQLTNKYAEGYPGKRYYGGCEHVDVAEQLAIDRVKQLFGAEPPTCSRIAARRPTRPCSWPAEARRHHHGHEPGRRRPPDPRHAAEHVRQVVQRRAYGLDAKEDIDYDAMEALAREHKPKLIIAGASAYALRIDFERFAKIAKEVGASSWSTWPTTPA
jgi:glycine hydroxymethyltransferase